MYWPAKIFYCQLLALAFAYTLGNFTSTTVRVKDPIPDVISPVEIDKPPDLTHTKLVKKTEQMDKNEANYYRKIPRPATAYRGKPVVWRNQKSVEDYPETFPGKIRKLQEKNVTKNEESTLVGLTLPMSILIGSILIVVMSYCCMSSILGGVAFVSFKNTDSPPESKLTNKTKSRQSTYQRSHPGLDISICESADHSYFTDWPEYYGPRRQRSYSIEKNPTAEKSTWVDLKRAVSSFDRKPRRQNIRETVNSRKPSVSAGKNQPRYQKMFNSIKRRALPDALKYPEEDGLSPRRCQCCPPSRNRSLGRGIKPSFASRRPRDITTRRRVVYISVCYESVFFDRGKIYRLAAFEEFSYEADFFRTTHRAFEVL